MKSITMKGQTNHDFDLIIAGGSIGGSERPILANRADEYTSISGRDGSMHREGGLENSTIRVNFIKKNRNMLQWNEDRKAIAGWLHSKTETRIEFDDEPGIHYIGKVTSTDFPSMYSPRVQFSVEFTVQPFRYSDTIKRELSFRDGKTTVNNKGNYETPFHLKITVQSVASQVEFSVAGATLTYDGDFRSGDIVTIDTDLLEFRLNDELKVLEVDGAFELLQPGTNEISSTITGPHELVYQERSI